MTRAAYDLPAIAPPHRDDSRVAAASFVLSLRERGIRDVAVLRAMELVPRAFFAPRRCADLAATDAALPLPCGQTMTAPSTVALMLAALGAAPGQRILEIGTGSGYVAALLAGMGCAVHSIERQPILAESASARLAEIAAPGSVAVAIGDGLVPDAGGGLFERILVNGSLPALPTALTARLAVGGRLVGAVRDGAGVRLARVDRREDGSLAVAIQASLRLAPLVAAAAAANLGEA